MFLGQFRSPLVLILTVAALVALFVGDTIDTAIILTIVFVSATLGCWQERGANTAVETLLATIELTTSVRRDGETEKVSVETVVPGDIVELSVGNMVPGDRRIIETTDLYVNEAALTGETDPAEKTTDPLPADIPLARRSNALFMGTNVVSGAALAVVVRTGHETEFGAVSRRLHLRAPTTEFERGIRRFGRLFSEGTLLLIIGIFAINVYFARPVLDSFLFALALAA